LAHFRPVSKSWAVYERVADRYDTVIPFFREFAVGLLDLLDPPPGTRLLDVGAGRGAIARVAADRGCAVTAIDAAARMVELLFTADPRVDARVMDAHVLDLPADRYDLATGGFMIHMVDDAVKVLAELNRVLRPGGTVALTVPGGSCDDGGRWDRYHDIVGEYVPKATDPNLPQPIDVAEALTAAGFVGVRTANLEVHLPVADAQTYWDFQLSHGFAGFFESLPPADAAELRERALAELSTTAAGGAITIDRGAAVYLAETPA
jgi:SAM-dependent methyltransferase